MKYECRTGGEVARAVPLGARALLPRGAFKPEWIDAEGVAS